MVLPFIAHRVVLIAMLAFAAFAGTAQAAADDRALKLFFTHTGEKATIVFKRNGKFDPRGLAQINRFLRDWRKNEPAKIDPELLDLVWEVYRRTGTGEAIHVVSAYRSPSTNNMLRNRSRSSGVAKHSQHTLGKAMDFYIPGVKLATLRSIAMQLQVGGVGFYPTSGSPFVHLDVGNVRAWPRMSRQELARLFPNGRTLHLPASGSPLPGYAQAVAAARGRSHSTDRKIATLMDDDDIVTASTTSSSSPAGSSLVTALLPPTPRNRASEGLELQLGKRVEEESKSSPFADLASYAIPLPALRPSSVAAVVPVADKTDPLVFASLVVGRHSTGKLVVSDHSENSVGNAAGRLQPMATPPSATTREMSAGVGAMSTGALVAWALQPVGVAMEMTLPTPVGAPLPMERSSLEPESPGVDVDDDDFDLERFGFEG